MGQEKTDARAENFHHALEKLPVKRDREREGAGGASGYMSENGAGDPLLIQIVCVCRTCVITVVPPLLVPLRDGMRLIRR